MRTYYLHGFLGKETDHADGVDLYSFSDPLDGLETFAHSFNKQIDKNEENVLIGYSMGGRLALHCLAEAPGLWSRVILISTHPGLQSEEERSQRIQHDLEWAHAFEIDSWEDLMDHWNAQDVFCGEKVIRHEQDYTRKKLADSLRGWSLGKQRDFRPFLSQLNIPILWITGGKDEKFTQLGTELSFSHPDSSHLIIPEVGHRIELSCVERLKIS